MRKCSGCISPTVDCSLLTVYYPRSPPTGQGLVYWYSFGMERLTAYLHQQALSLGFDRIGVIPAAPGRRLEAYLRWVAAGQHGEMAYMARPDRVARRQDLNVILPGVQNIICVAVDYATLQLPPEVAQDPSRGRVSNYAWGVDYHEVMQPRLEMLASWLKEQVKDSAVFHRVYVDTGPLLERDHAETAGLGFTGKNSMLIAPKHGSYCFLGEILTTLPLAPSHFPPHVSPSISCGSCRRCLDACPTQAFPQPYVLDAQRCISYLTIELKGWIPKELRPLMGNWVYGCDICQQVCPFNRFAGKGESEQWTVNSEQWRNAAPPLLQLLGLTEEQFEARFAHSPIQRIKRAQLVRNACVAAGNWGSQTAVSALIPLLQDPHPLVRGHAAWALHQIGGDVAKTAVSQALADETNETVKQELAEE